MDNNYNIELAKQDFRDELKKIEEAGQRIPETTNLKTVEEKGFLGVNKKVKGADFNSLTETLQNIFSEIYQTERGIIKEFDGIYRTFDRLDDEYIKAILISVNDAKIASDQAKSAGMRAEKALAEVSATLETQSLLIEKIKEFKDSTAKDINELHDFIELIENIEHFSDIDQIWNDVNTLYDENKLLSNEIKSYVEQIENLNENNQDLRNNIADISNLLSETSVAYSGYYNSLKNDFEELIHKNDLFIETANETLEKSHNKIKELNDKINQIKTEETILIEKNQILEKQQLDLQSIIENQKNQIDKLINYIKIIGAASIVGIILAIIGIIMYWVR